MSHEPMKVVKEPRPINSAEKPARNHRVWMTIVRMFRLALPGLCQIMKRHPDERRESRGERRRSRRQPRKKARQEGRQ